MRTVIRRRITVAQRAFHALENPHLPYYTYTSGSSSAGGGEAQACLFGPLPTKSYRVEYRLNPRGPYRMKSNYSNLRRVIRALPYARAGAWVCFLPKSWEGKRFSRRVL